MLAADTMLFYLFGRITKLPTAPTKPSIYVNTILSYTLSNNIKSYLKKIEK